MENPHQLITVAEMGQLMKKHQMRLMKGRRVYPSCLPTTTPKAKNPQNQTNTV